MYYRIDDEDKRKYYINEISIIKVSMEAFYAYFFAGFFDEYLKNMEKFFAL